jgi:D-alanyl-D-alanine carboxypeptidase (penicillin-binding protein 5/6)
LASINGEPVAGTRRARRRLRWLGVATLAVALAGAGLAALRLAGPLPAPRVIRAVPAQYVIPGSPPVLPWPRGGQATVEVDGLGPLGSSGGSRSVPIASVAKIMTAYLVLRDHPVHPDEDGPSLTVTAEEAAAYPDQLAARLSVVEVVAGEVLTERQALQALLLPSADNVAYILARWDAGGRRAFVARMNEAAAGFGMAGTRYTDPSGLDPATVSTAADQVKLARAALAIPALAQIVAMPQATVPVAGLVKNVNKLLGQDGIVGIKTGSTKEAGGCLVFAADVGVDGHPLRIIGAVLGPGPAMADAFEAGRRLVQAAGGVPRRYRAVRAGQLVATVRGIQGRGTTLVAAGDLEVLGWPGLSYRVDARTTVPGSVAAAARVGTLSLTTAGTSVATAVLTTGAIPPPTRWQRLTRR